MVKLFEVFLVFVIVIQQHSSSIQEFELLFPFLILFQSLDLPQSLNPLLISYGYAQFLLLLQVAFLHSVEHFSDGSALAGDHERQWVVLLAINPPLHLIVSVLDYFLQTETQILHRLDILSLLLQKLIEFKIYFAKPKNITFRLSFENEVKRLQAFDKHLFGFDKIKMIVLVLLRRYHLTDRHMLHEVYLIELVLEVLLP